jgi:hypothetical protein
MKNTLKFNVGVRLVLAIVSCLSTKAHASLAYEEPRAFVLACNEAYTGSTATVIQSLKDNNLYTKKVAIFTRGIKDESKAKLERMEDGFTSIFIIDLSEEKWETMSTFGGGTIDLIASIERIEEGQWGDVVFENEQDGNKTYKFWINLRLFFPEIWASGFLPRELKDINSFLWLDSDLIAFKDLSDLFKICERYPNQPMIGANLQNEGQYFDDPSGFDPNFGSCQTVCKEDMHTDMSKLIKLQCTEDYERITYLISGGVVFWRIKKS